MLGTGCLAKATKEELDMVDGDLEALARQKGMPADRPVVKAGFGAGISYSCAKATRLLGYEAEVGFARGIALTEAWSREAGLLGCGSG